MLFLCAGDRTQGFLCARQAFCQLSHCTSPQPWVLREEATIPLHLAAVSCGKLEISSVGQWGARCEMDGDDCDGGRGELKRASSSLRDFHGAHSDGSRPLKGTVASHGSPV